MAHNYEDRGLPDGMELNEMHKHSDGETMEQVNATHRMTAGPGSSEEAYGGASKGGERELTPKDGESEPSTGTPREFNDGFRYGAK